MTDGPDSGHNASIRDYYDQLRQMCSTANLSLSKFVVGLIRLTSLSVPELSDAVFDTRVDVLEAALKASNERASALEMQVASKEVDIYAKVAKVESMCRTVDILNNWLPSYNAKSTVYTTATLEFSPLNLG